MEASDFIDEILIPDSISSFFSSDRFRNALPGLRKLNVLLGPNNSGKSTLLRSLFGEGPSLRVSNGGNAESVKLRESLNILSSAFEQHPEISELRMLKSMSTSLMQIKEPYFHISQGREQAKPFQFNSDLNFWWQQHRDHANTVLKKASEAVLTIRDSIARLSREEQRISETGQGASVHAKFKHATLIYIPTLRGMRRPPTDSERFFYRDRTFTDYFAATARFKDLKPHCDEAELEKFQIFTGLEMYDIVRDFLLGDLGQRKIVEGYQDYISKTFFAGLPLAIIPRKGKDVLFVRIGNEKEREISRLGDGIQQLMILTFPLFFFRNRYLLLFIEEPDVHLHPGFQRILIDTLLSDSDGADRQVFVTTHSQQFLDLTIASKNCSIYRVQKEQPTDSDTDELEPKFKVAAMRHGDLELLRDIGVRPSSVMLANCTIWVEGVTDRLYLRNILEVLQNEKDDRWVESLHYSFVEYGGANVTHWSFYDPEEGIDVERLCPHLFLIADFDSFDKDSRSAKLEAHLGERYYRLPVKEIENLLSPETIKKVVLVYEGSSVNLKNFQYSDYKHAYLGRFIESHVLPDHYVSKRKTDTRRPYSAKSGTVKGKVPFCRRAVKQIKTKADLTVDAIHLGEAVLAFIKQQNTL